ncbi:1-aminocyclopropane-1-carboxylate deaminase/D-cysteine desulfhydrase [Chryseobacterium koreense]|uniref:1-aminocyclopropane-1-carboxylate deaminase/D-cysteine desulfhydrase n=1 Tax=Chryseobacterium koreense TaxID=232216 RepID=UPI0026F1EDB0|nr:pyridoxal-phosphate dependent enzyme [Chryseobacterium koreense]
MKLPEIEIPITEIPLNKNIRLFIKREDLIHPEISGNKYWKLFYNINHYLDLQPSNPLLITFGGAFSNHISAVAALGKSLGIKTLGIIRGEEIFNKWQQNPTLSHAQKNGMDFRFVTRTEYRDKPSLTKTFEIAFPNALIIPEGGSNFLAVEGIKHMLDERTKSFDYLCTAVGTGGTVAGISKSSEKNQKILGFKVVDDSSLGKRISEFSGKDQIPLLDAHFGGYGKITDENIRFINWFSNEFGIPLDPIYTGKMMQRIFELMDEGFFPQGSKILAFHTGGLQGIEGANEMLRKQGRTLIIE